MTGRVPITKTRFFIPKRYWNDSKAGMLNMLMVYVTDEEPSDKDWFVEVELKKI